ncbi:proteinase inhibitor I78 [Peterkaempfera griseoplana]|uniref:proteinase inhibitor I78 n=1 Tax=Peterkaempfera griseoplana TaxID=66896 RepID=UPI0006E43B75|nr:proteinase inhibitor I78 [Peterkaempfera griseoplana]
MSDIPEPPQDDPEGYLGLPAEQAETTARARGWTAVRVVPRDALVTLEYRVGRINFAVDAGLVVRCWTG